MEPTFYKKMRQRTEEGSLRSLFSLNEQWVDFWSNDYLGLGRKATSITLTAGTGSRLISGNTNEIERVEQFLANHFESESALVFNSGYDANLGFFSAIPQKGDTILYDANIHASVRDGVRLSFAQSFSFAHNDVASLESRLKKAAGTIYVAIESIYSMDGDMAPLEAIVSLCERYGALLIVDEAHAGGIFGENGIGLCKDTGIISRVFARLVTFGKGFGAHGAAILGSHELRTYLINFSRSFIYTTALPEAMYTHIEAQVLAAKSEDLRHGLVANIHFFKRLFPESISNNRSPIQIVPIQPTAACLYLAEQLRANGFAVKAILPPTVSKGNECLRFCIHSFNTVQEIRRLRATFDLLLSI
jgi:8-amino-7-oxononanoate synthase